MLLKLLIIALIAAFAGFIILSFAVTIMTYYRRVELFAHTPEDYGMTAQTLDFTSSDGIALKAWWFQPQFSGSENPTGVVILLHGMTNMDASSLISHATFLSKAGYHTIILDMRAHGRSRGKRICLAIKEPNDVIPLLDWIKEQDALNRLPLILWGFSLGAATAIRTAAIRPDVDGVISVSSYSSIDILMYDQLSTSGTMKIFMDIYISFVQLAILILYGQFPIKAAPLKSMPKLSPHPVLIAHGNADSQISVKHARFLKSVGGANAHLWVAEGKGHCIFTGDATGEENKEYRRQMMDFISRIKRKKKRKSRE